MLGDLLASVAALIAGAVIYFTGWLAADPILSLLITALILIGTLNLTKDIWQTLYSKKSGELKHDKHDGHAH